MDRAQHICSQYALSLSLSGTRRAPPAVFQTSQWPSRTVLCTDALLETHLPLLLLALALLLLAPLLFALVVQLPPLLAFRFFSLSKQGGGKWDQILLFSRFPIKPSFCPLIHQSNGCVSKMQSGMQKSIQIIRLQKPLNNLTFPFLSSK